MSITSATLYNTCKVSASVKRKFENVEPEEDVVDSLLSDTLSIKRRKNEIELMKAKLKEKALLLDKASNSVLNKSKRKRGKNNKFSKSKMKDFGFHCIPKEGQRYEYFIPINELWNQYIMSTFTSSNGQFLIKADERMMKLDYHGAEMTVYTSVCKSYIGLKGIVAKETRNTIQLITVCNELKVVPKKGTVFVFDLNGYQVKLNGDLMIGRPGVRMTKKIKQQAQADLLIS